MWKILCVTLCVGSAFAAKPNFVIILTDDQDFESVKFMPSVSETFRQEGVTFTNAYATTPVCCPSRSSLLTGMYQHRHGVYNNSKSGGCYAFPWIDGFEPYSLGPRMYTAQYRTFYAGKYLNEYKGERVPPGWDWWYGLDGNSVYYNYTVNINGSRYSFQDRPEDYFTDVLANWAVDFLTVALQDKYTPFFMVISTPAPHEPFTPSPKYAGRFSSLFAPRYPNFNYGKDKKHWLVRSGNTLKKEAVKLVDEAYGKRLATLLSVDDLFKTVNSLVPENTYVIYTSDHGFHLGQFSQAWDKRQPYEWDIKIPLKIKGPGIAAGAQLPHPVTNIDIAPTIYDILGLPKLPMDGQSFFPILLNPPSKWGRQFFIEYQGEGGNGEPCTQDKNVKLCSKDLECNCFDARNNSFACLRHLSMTSNTISCLFKDEESFEEYYDLNTDPYQINNLAAGAG